MKEDHVNSNSCPDKELDAGKQPPLFGTETAQNGQPASDQRAGFLEQEQRPAGPSIRPQPGYAPFGQQVTQPGSGQGVPGSGAVNQPTGNPGYAGGMPGAKQPGFYGRPYGYGNQAGPYGQPPYYSGQNPAAGRPPGNTGGPGSYPAPPRKGMSQGAVVGLVIACCATLLLSVIIFTVGMVMKATIEASGSSYAQSSPPYDDYYDGYYGYGDDWGVPPAPDGTEEDALLPDVHTEGTHNEIQFLVSGLGYATGEELDGVENGKEYLVVALSAANMGEEEVLFQLKQLTLEDKDGGTHSAVFPEYSYGYGLLPDSVTLQSRYTVRGAIIFECQKDFAQSLHIYESDGCLKLTIPLPEDIG